MKIRILGLIAFLLFLNCTNDNQLAFESASFNEHHCAECPLIEITVPKALGDTKMSRTVNTVIKEEIISLLHFDDETKATDIKSAIASFTKDYQVLKEKYTEEFTPWEAKIDGVISYEDKTILTVRLDVYLFTGGAHGYGTSRFLNFDKKRAVELENSELFVNLENFEAFAETRFRIQEKIGEQRSINSTGFMFETDAFYLPENIGYTKEGLELFYEQYEIASYADGPIVLTLPYKDVKKHLAIKSKP